MRNRQYYNYKNLKKNNTNNIVYFEGNERIEKTFASFSEDIDRYIRILKSIESSKKEINRIGILGPTSYKWVVIDHACIKGGYKSAGLPESLGQETIIKIVKDLKIDILLIDFSLKVNYDALNDLTQIYYFNCNSLVNNDIELIDYHKQTVSEDNLIQEDYSIVFSSGTSENIKYINRKFHKIKREKKSLIEKLKLYWNYKGSIWYILKKKKNNKLIIYLPLSHPMQRWFVQIAINYRINVVLSDPKNCIKHIMMERPNIMVSIPAIYDAMALLIEARIARFDKKQRRLFSIFKKCYFYKLREGNLIKKYFSKRLFQKVEKIYGGRGDLFITGSAPAKRKTLETFEKIGIRLYEAYSQSELSTIIMNSPRHYRLGSVGKPSKNLAVKIGLGGEVLIKYNEDHDSENKEVLNVKNEYIHTGDSGYFDKQGFLYITGRLDDVIVLDRGKKVHPGTIQNKLSDLLNVEHVVIYSENNETISCLIFSKLLNDKKVKSHIANLNKTLADYEKIKKFRIINDIPSIENGLLTSTLKLKRKAIIKKYTKGILMATE